MSGVVLFQLCFALCLMGTVHSISFEDLKKDYDFAESLRVECNQELTAAREEKEKLKDEISSLETALRQERDRHVQSKNTLELRELKVKHQKEEIEAINRKVSDRDKEISLLKNRINTVESDLRLCRIDTPEPYIPPVTDFDSSQHHLDELHKVRQELLDCKLEIHRKKHILENSLVLDRPTTYSVALALAAILVLGSLFACCRTVEKPSAEEAGEKKKTPAKKFRAASKGPRLDVLSSDEDDDDDRAVNTRSVFDNGTPPARNQEEPVNVLPNEDDDDDDDDVEMIEDEDRFRDEDEIEEEDSVPGRRGVREGTGPVRLNPGSPYMHTPKYHEYGRQPVRSHIPGIGVNRPGGTGNISFDDHDPRNKGDMLSGRRGRGRGRGERGPERPNPQGRNTPVGNQGNDTKSVPPSMRGGRTRLTRGNTVEKS